MRSAPELRLSIRINTFTARFISRILNKSYVPDEQNRFPNDNELIEIVQGPRERDVAPMPEDTNLWHRPGRLFLIVTRFLELCEPPGTICAHFSASPRVASKGARSW
jgi:hypothetical protein